MKTTLKTLAKRLLAPFNLVVPATINGRRFKIPILRGIGASNLSITELWMVDTLQRLLKLAPGTAFLDVGVNLGQSLLKLKSVDPEVRYIGFEPNPFCIQYVQELIRVNNLSYCELVPTGLADNFGLVDFIADSEADTAGSIIGNLRPGKESIRRQHIPVLVFDDIREGLIPSNSAVVKIDVEGAELEVMSGMRKFLLEQRPWVTCEVLHAHTEAQLPMLRERNNQLWQLLVKVNYAPFRILKDATQTHVVGLEAIEAFGEGVWNPKTSPPLCDYLLVPSEAIDDTLRVFSSQSA
jgi:FkbM family methyltransferase